MAYASPLITLLSTARVAAGAASLLAPSPTLSLFRMSTVPVPGPALVTTRMFGIRDVVLGTLLYTADDPAAVRRALIAGAVADGVDALGAAYGAWNGDLTMLGADLFGGGAVLFLVMGLFGLRGLSTGLKGLGK